MNQINKRIFKVKIKNKSELDELMNKADYEKFAKENSNQMLKNAQKDFIQRHIGPSIEEQNIMLKELGYKNLDDASKDTKKKD